MTDEERMRFQVKRAGRGLGLGLYTRVPIAKGSFVIEYTGNRVTTAVADNLPGRYLFEIDEHWTIDGSPRSNLARYINHACVPNCEADVVDGRIHILALRNIEPGEQLLYDYGEEYFDEFIRPVGCKCHACSGPLMSCR